MSKVAWNAKSSTLLAPLALSVLGGAVLSLALAEEPGNGLSIRNLTPDVNSGWVTDRPTGDDFLPPPSGPGPVMSMPGRPYVPNGGGRQSTYRVADLSNPILKPWAIAQMKKVNDDVLADKVPFITRERCWPAGVPGFTVFSRVQPTYFLQTPKKIVMFNELNQEYRHIYLDVPHTAKPKPSWYGESVGRYEGDELVVDTIGLNDRTFVDNYRTPHTEQIHVVERFKLIEGGKILQAHITVDDPGTFNMPWSAIQRWRSVNRPTVELICAENNEDIFGHGLAPMPEAKKADF